MARTSSVLLACVIGLASLLGSNIGTYGAEWTILREDDILRDDGIEGMLQDIYFRDDQNGIAVGNGGLILVTTDSGLTWEKMENDRPPSSNGDGQRAGGPQRRPGRGTPPPLYNIYFVDNQIGFITGARGTILKTTDSGETWERKRAISEAPGRNGNPRPLRSNLMGIQMINATTGFIAGTENTILKTTDGGETWIGRSERARVGETRNNLENICFVSPTTGWIIGSFGTLLYTQDSGQTWTKRDPAGFDNNLFGIHFLDQNTGWICGQEGLILNTTDGGNTWHQQKTDSPDDLNDIIFVDTNVGWAVGGYNTILHTTDGGKTWALSKLPGGANLMGVHATNRDACWAVNDWGVIAGYKSKK